MAIVEQLEESGSPVRAPEIAAPRYTLRLRAGEVEAPGGKLPLDDANVPGRCLATRSPRRRLGNYAPKNSIPECRLLRAQRRKKI